jgi:hypothetical protein
MKEIDYTSDERESHKKDEWDGEKKLIRCRERVNRLHFQRKMSKNVIARMTGMSKEFVIRWTQSEDQAFDEDHRGWRKGQRRKWSRLTEERISSIHSYLVESPAEFYVGATSVAQRWRWEYPGEAIPPLRTIGQIMKDLGLTKRRRKRNTQGASRYLCYPEQTVYSIGERVMEADFVGIKYIRGQRVPIHFLGFSTKKAPKMRYYERVRSTTASCFMKTCMRVFQEFEVPDCIKVDNAPAMIGSSSGKRNISRVMAYLFQQEVIPIFSVPRRPFSQASIEGNNSVFSRKFWNTRTFSSLEEIDRDLDAFNQASRRYHSYETVPGKPRTRQFYPLCYFLRQVAESSDTAPEGMISILNEIIPVEQTYINYFVISKWDISNETLTTSIERDGKLYDIDKREFQVNKQSRKLLP